MKACIIIIGNEILSGKTLDTNSNFIAKKLQLIGIRVIEIFTIPDHISIIKSTLDQAKSIADIVITTGGLGPTNDDITKTAFNEYFNDQLIFDEITFRHLKNLLEAKGRQEILERNREQAMVLSKAKVFQNDYGTAPCLLIEEENKLIICLPGVPSEVKPLVKDKIIPFLQDFYSLNFIVNRTVSIVDIPESMLAQSLEEWEATLPSTIEVAYLPTDNLVKLSLTCEGSNKQEMYNALDHHIERIKPIISKNVLSYDTDDLLTLLKLILSKRSLTISTAESCTCGEIARILTSIGGSSAYYIGGVIPYDYHQKIKILGVKEATINKENVVSESVAIEMAKGCKELFSTSIAISTTGVAGPSTDQFNNEVGTVYYAIAIDQDIYSYKMFLPHLEREDFVTFVSQKIIEKLIGILLK